MIIPVLAALSVCAAFALAADPVPKRAAGTFDVKVVPLTLDDKDAPSTMGRMSLNKQYHGDLEATAKGEMLSAMTGTQGSGVYVAIERVTGKLHGRTGTFVLQHTGKMARGAQQLNIAVAPDSGTGELTGLAGKMSIVIEGGKHSYVFEYSLPVR
jgi:hypothetical protein